MPRVTVARTLDEMAEVYRLERRGGPASPRFAAYVTLAQSRWGIPAYNPMAGDHARLTVDALRNADAEAVVARAAERALTAVDYQDLVTLAVVVPSPGMWTDRLSTELEARTFGSRSVGKGLIMCWAGEPPALEILEREAGAEAIRVAWHAVHGAVRTARDVLAREGLAYGWSGAAAEVAQDTATAVHDALAVVGESPVLGDAAALLYGDDDAAALGWPGLGVAPRAGARWATWRMASAVRDTSAAIVFRAGARALA